MVIAGFDRRLCDARSMMASFLEGQCFLFFVLLRSEVLLRIEDAWQILFGLVHQKEGRGGEGLEKLE